MRDGMFGMRDGTRDAIIRLANIYIRMRNNVLIRAWDFYFNLDGTTDPIRNEAGTIFLRYTLFRLRNTTI